MVGLGPFLFYYILTEVLAKATASVEEHRQGMAMAMLNSNVSIHSGSLTRSLHASIYLYIYIYKRGPPPGALVGITAMAVTRLRGPFRAPRRRKNIIRFGLEVVGWR